MGGNPAGLVAWAGLAVGYGLGVRAIRRLGRSAREEPAASGNVIRVAPSRSVRDRRAARTARFARGEGRA